MNIQTNTACNAIIKRVDRKDLINQLRALKDGYVTILFEKYSHEITLKDRTHTIFIQDRN